MTDTKLGEVAGDIGDKIVEVVPQIVAALPAPGDFFFPLGVTFIIKIGVVVLIKEEVAGSTHPEEPRFILREVVAYLAAAPVAVLLTDWIGLLLMTANAARDALRADPNPGLVDFRQLHQSQAGMGLRILMSDVAVRLCIISMLAALSGLCAALSYLGYPAIRVNL